MFIISMNSNFFEKELGILNAKYNILIDGIISTFPKRPDTDNIFKADIVKMTQPNPYLISICSQIERKLGYKIKDITTAKYSSVGSLLWLMSYNNYSYLDDYGVKVAADNAGNVFVGGYGYNSNQNNDYIVVKYNSAGAQTGVVSFNGADGLEDVLSDMVIDGTLVGSLKEYEGLYDNAIGDIIEGN